MKYFSKDEVVLIENDKNGWYEKAVFILNKDVPKKKRPKDIVGEAEKIIEDYMKKNRLNYSLKKHKKRNIDFVLNLSLFLSIVLFIYCVAQVL